jgi:DnaJ family protein A protein 2
MGPGMYQQTQKTCDKCKGEGEIIAESARCKTCNGKKTIEKEKVIEVGVDKGVPNNYPIKIPGEGNEIPDALAGDLVFITRELPHNTFQRVGADLFMTRKITLIEALTGFEFMVKHLDGTEYKLYTAKQDVITDGMKKTVRGLGMPFFKDPMSHGNLIV